MAKENYVTPAGKTAWICVVKPNTKWKEEGEYQVDLDLQSSDKNTKALKKLFDAKAKEACEEFGKPQHPDSPSYTVNPEDADGNPIKGITRFKFKQKAKTAEGMPNSINLFDAKANPLIGVEPSSGSVVKVAFDWNLWDYEEKAVATAQINGVQVLKLVSAGDEELKQPVALAKR